MWEQHHERDSFVRTKLSDLAALVSAFLALAVTVTLSALSSGRVMRKVLGWFGLERAPGVECGAADCVCAGVGDDLMAAFHLDDHQAAP